jgi:hypothetical protein
VCACRRPEAPAASTGGMSTLCWPSAEGCEHPRPLRPGAPRFTVRDNYAHFGLPVVMEQERTLSGFGRAQHGSGSNRRGLRFGTAALLVARSRAPSAFATRPCWSPIAGLARRRVQGRRYLCGVARSWRLSAAHPRARNWGDSASDWRARRRDRHDRNVIHGGVRIEPAAHVNSGEVRSSRFPDRADDCHERLGRSHPAACGRRSCEPPASAMSGSSV